MIVRPRPGFLHLFFIMRGSVVPRILPQIFGFGLYGALVVLAVRALKLDFGNAGTAPFALLGVALSIYLGFRNNAAYDRWWEARKLWGSWSSTSATWRAPRPGWSKTGPNCAAC